CRSYGCHCCATPVNVYTTDTASARWGQEGGRYARQAFSAGLRHEALIGSVTSRERVPTVRVNRQPMIPPGACMGEPRVTASADAHGGVLFLYGELWRQAEGRRKMLIGSMALLIAAQCV